MSALTSRNQVGRREDISDMIALVDARQTEFTSACPKGQEPTNPLMQWQVDSYLDPTTVGIVEDQDRTVFENHTNRAVLQGRIHIVERAPKVSRVAQNVSDVAGIGRRKEFAKSVAKAITVAKRDIEARALCNDDSQADNGIVGYETRGLMNWGTANAASDLPVPTEAQTPSAAVHTGAWTAVTETLLRETILGAIWEETGTMGNFQLFAGRSLKSLISSWTIYTPDVSSNTTVRTFQDDDATILRATVDRLEGDFGSLEIRLTPWLHRELDLAVTANKTRADRSGLIVDLDMVEIRYNSRPAFRAFEDAGGGPRGLVEAIWGLVVKNPKCLGIIDPQS